MRTSSSIKPMSQSRTQTHNKVGLQGSRDQNRQETMISPLPVAASTTGSRGPIQKRDEGVIPIRGSENSLVYQAKGLFEDFFFWPPGHGCLNPPSLPHRLWQLDKGQLLKVSLKFNLPTSSPAPKGRQRRTRGIGISKWWVVTWWNTIQP